MSKTYNDNSPEFIDKITAAVTDRLNMLAKSRRNNLVTDQSIADYLGISIASLRRHANEIPHVRIGNQRIANPDALDAWLSGRLLWTTESNQTAPPAPGRPRKRPRLAKGIEQ